MRRLAEAALCTLLVIGIGSGAARAGTITGVTAGSGLTGGGTNGNVTLSANFAGDGVTPQVCHSDHTHLGQHWDASDTDGLHIELSCTANDSTCRQTGIFATTLSTAGGVGVEGLTHAAQGVGVLGSNLATSGQSTGISGGAISPDGHGVVGTAGNGTSGRPLGVWGSVQAPLGTGAMGTNDATSGAGFGVYGQTQSPAGFAVAGHNLATTGNAIAVDGESSSAAGYGGYFRNLAGGTGMRVRVDHATSATKFISASNGAYLSSGGTWTNASDVHLKDHFAPVDDGAVLRKLQAMPIQEWSYKSEGATIRHVGPTAQDFRAAFALGSDDKTITTVDEAGIALAAIQELDRRTAEIAELKAQVARLEAAVQALQAARP